ncbi:MAG: glucokinase [Acidobacteria bacterium]|nr:glucokinase [Acidobacteriota bacterium]
MGTMLLAGDVGGTKTQLGLYSAVAGRPVRRCARRYGTRVSDGLGGMGGAFLGSTGGYGPIDAACGGVAGPVQGRTSRLTNVPWLVDADDVARHFAIDRVRLLNDVEATAHAVSALDDDQLAVLQRGKPDPNGNAALIAAGTGLGEALLHRVGKRFMPVASEAGHADFAARTSREAELQRALTDRFGRASYERVISGPGLVNIHAFAHAAASCPAVANGAPAADRPALVSRSGLAGDCPACAETLELFAGVLGAEAGNLGLRSTATAGVFLGGGIPAKILPALQTATFLDAFRDKAPMSRLVAAMPVAVIVEPDAALLGAAVAAAGLLADNDEA